MHYMSKDSTINKDIEEYRLGEFYFNLQKIDSLSCEEKIEWKK